MRRSMDLFFALIVFAAFGAGVAVGGVATFLAAATMTRDVLTPAGSPGEPASLKSPENAPADAKRLSVVYDLGEWERGQVEQLAHLGQVPAAHSHDAANDAPYRAPRSTARSCKACDFVKSRLEALGQKLVSRDTDRRPKA